MIAFGIYGKSASKSSKTYRQFFFFLSGERHTHRHCSRRSLYTRANSPLRRTLLPTAAPHPSHISFCKSCWRAGCMQETTKRRRRLNSRRGSRSSTERVNHCPYVRTAVSASTTPTYSRPPAHRDKSCATNEAQRQRRGTRKVRTAEDSPLDHTAVAVLFVHRHSREMNPGVEA